MNPDDPLTRLLHSAAAAANQPVLPSGLPARVRLRQQRRRNSARRIRGGLATSAVIIVLAMSLRFLSQRDGLRPVARSLPDAEIAQLRAESDRLAAEAAALERQLSRIKNQEARTELRQEHASHVLAAATDPLSPLDRAALVGISQGDFYRDIRQSLDEAKAAYESVLAEFPETRWATIAQSRIDLLPMN
jgi:hypothetical protein